MANISAFSRQKRLALLLGLGVLFFLGLPAVSRAETYTREPEIRIYDPVKREVEHKFYSFPQTFAGGASVAACQLRGDAKAELVVGAGPGGGPQIRMFRADGSYLNGFFAYELSMTHGVNVACGDFDEDGVDEIVTAPKFGGGPQVRVFDANGKAKFNNGFMAFHSDFHGGVNLAVGDITGDGKDEILGAAGPGSSPHIRVFDALGRATGTEFRPFHHDADKGGVSVAVANVDGGKEAEVVASIFQAGKSWVKVYKNDSAQSVVGMFRAYDEGLDSGVRVAGGNFRGNGIEEIIAIPNIGGGPQLKFFKGHGEASLAPWFGYEESFRGGVHLATGDTDGDGRDEVIVAPGRRVAEGRTDLHQYIEVNLTEQRLYAFEDGYLQYTALISSGLRGFDTPAGEFKILRKVPIMDYRWTYAPGSRLNYNIPNVKYNLEFKRHFYLHNAYWHNDFGRRKSHGCVNMDMKTSEWIYNWAEVGTTVIIHD